MYQLLNGNRQFEHPLSRLLAGSAAGTISVLFTYPLDVARARIAYTVHTKPQKHALYNSLMTPLKESGGIAVLYRGFVPTIMGIVPYAGVSFFTYDTLKHFFQQHWNTRYENESSKALPTPIRLTVGAVAGAVAQTVAYPLDVVRRQMQVEHVRNASASSTLSMSKVAKLIFAKEGIRGFFVGLSINYIKVAPTTGVSFVTYEYLKNLLVI